MNLFKYIIKPILIIVILIGCHSGISYALKHNETSLLTEPDNCLRFFLRIDYDDKGLKSAVDLIIQSFVQSRIVQNRDLQISNISLPVFDKIWGNIYISNTGETIYFITGHIVSEASDISMKIGDLAVSLKIGDKKSSKMLRKTILSGLLSKHIGGADGIKTETGIVYNKGRNKRGELSAYTFIEDNIIVGSTLNIVEYAKRNFNNLNTQATLNDKTDGYITLENKNNLLLRLLNKYSSNLGFSLATSPDLNKINNLKIKFDVVDQDRIKLSFNLISSDITSHGQNILQNDIKFILDLLSRICMRKNIDFSYNLKDNLNVDIELNSLGKYWNSLTGISNTTN
ncbi:hypothetical protein KKC91_11840 [bacterium]|nr:hypothetical protein [bacterium]